MSKLIPVVLAVGVLGALGGCAPSAELAISQQARIAQAEAQRDAALRELHQVRRVFRSGLHK